MRERLGRAAAVKFLMLPHPSSEDRPQTQRSCVSMPTRGSELRPRIGQRDHSPAPLHEAVPVDGVNHLPKRFQASSATAFTLLPAVARSAVCRPAVLGQPTRMSVRLAGVVPLPANTDGGRRQ
jgi:hypothetical protein